MNSKMIFAIVISIIMLMSSFAIFDNVNNSATGSNSVNNPITPDALQSYYNYTIDFQGVPGGTGTYSQLITIPNPSDYGINSNGDNILFYLEGNHTELYAWIQSINSTSLSIWVKNYNSNSVIDMEVFPTSYNLCTNTGHLENLDMRFSGVAGLKSDCFYANSTNGDYLNFTMHGNFTRITYDVNTTGLGDFDFFASQQGKGQMVRLDSRTSCPDSAIATINSWTSWNVPPKIYHAIKNTWYFVSITNVSNVWIYNITSESNDTTTHLQDWTVSYYGHYFGFIGDALGGSYITNWKNVTFYNTTSGTTGFFDTSSMPTYTISQAYTVTFTETGLPAGSTWYVNITGGQFFSSNTGTISFTETNGTYTYTVATSKQGYEPSKYSGSFTVNGAPVTIHISMVKPSLTAVDILSQYNVSVNNVSPPVLYNNTYNNNHNYGLVRTSTNEYNTNATSTIATSTITSVWVDAAYSDANCTMATNSYGYTILYSHTTDKYHYIGSPYDSITTYYGPVTGIAGTKNYDDSGYPIIVLLTQCGYIFNYYQGSWSLFKNASNYIIKLPGSNWASLTANTYDSPNTNFYATNLNGTVWYEDTSALEYGEFNSHTSAHNIISTAAYCDETSTSDDNLFGLSYSGYVYYLTSSGWEIFNTTPLPSGSISIALSGLNNPYLYVLNIHNNTSLYVSESEVTSVYTSAFSDTSGIIDHKQTNEALAVYCSESGKHHDTIYHTTFYAYQTNGTVLNYSSTATDITDFNWEVNRTNEFPAHEYLPFIGLKDVDSNIEFNVIFLYDSSTGLNNINCIFIYYNNSQLYKEFSVVNGIKNTYETPVTITTSTPVTVNLTFIPNSAYNSYMEFFVGYYYKGVYIFYLFNINIINHFSYWEIS